MSVSFLKLSETFEIVEKTASRNEMTEILKDLYENLSIDEVQMVSYMLQGRVAPSFIPAEFNFSEKSVLNILSTMVGKDVLTVRAQTGDIGLTAEKVLSGEGGKMSISDVYDLLWSVVNTSGSGSSERKAGFVSAALSSMSALEAKYLSRIVSGNLRLGASVKTLLDAFSISLVGDKSKRGLLDHAYGVSTDIGYIAKLVYGKAPERALESVTAQPGTPVSSRLVERVKTFEELFERLGESFYIQPKYDGLRCQIHKSEDGFAASYEGRVWDKRFEVLDPSASLFSQSAAVVRLFTRNLEDVTEMFPEIVEAAKQIPANSFILDSEVIGWDAKAGTFKTYQDTMTRRRKYDVGSASKDVPVRAFLFDILYLDGQPLLEIDTEKRLKVLEDVGVSAGSEIVLSESIEVFSVAEVRARFEKWVGMGLEGLIAKTKGGGYTPGSRNFEWIKMKKSVSKDLVDTVDLVVLGYYFGSGKRAGFGVGAILGGVYNTALDRYESVTSIGTGITDEMFKSILVRLEKAKAVEKPKNVIIEDILEPDVYVNPEVVISVEADSISKAIGKKDRPAEGLSLRFPRLVEFDRDKIPQDATSVEELERIYMLSIKS